MKNCVLVTLADSKHINQAKQVFSGAYFNAGWCGDYLLLAHEIPEEKLKWFRDRGILIKKCEALYNKNFGRISLVTLDKFYLFETYFKQWKNVVYLDTDVIISAPVNRLANVNGFCAVLQNGGGTFLKEQFWNIPNDNSYEIFNKKFKNSYDPNEQIFNAGVLAFSTEILNNETFSQIKNLFSDYATPNMTGDQPILNLFFYRKWKKLPLTYNVSPSDTKSKPSGIILHFMGQKKPWDTSNPFYDIWKNNLQKSNSLNANTQAPIIKEWSWPRIVIYSHYLRIRRLLYVLTINPREIMGLISILLEKIFPPVRYVLKKFSQNRNER